ncbi:response regulator [Pararhodospirillum photometricum]|uniref:Response regulator receiver domain protein (CheY) n=1 Tax=Pararhodospirillum photometricum DSM 122 TaxID=1150469 RepID=H6SPR0_PARPM|nr:response regulator [Pararhodospirillum photometricum]CCG07180.1 Response regulator receiver domain protein (CheY) [Pararhodospirillum photometricum DSM 122]
MITALVVDDVAVVRMVITKILKRAGHQALTAETGAEALTLAQSHAVDVLITDIWMPDMDGIELLKQFKTRFPRVGRVAMSGGSPINALDDSLSTAVSAGASVVIMKPVDKNELLLAIDNALAAVGANPERGQP